MASNDRLSTGVTGLDEILGGGLPGGHMYLLEGDPGAGKTTLALQFLLEARNRNDTALYVTLSESIRELQQIVRSHGWSIEGLNLLETLPSVETLLPEDQYTVFQPADVELANTFKRISDEVNRLNPVCVVIDSLAELRILSHDLSRYRRHLLALKQFFESRRCTVLLLDNVGSAGSERYDASVLSVVHGVFRLEHLNRIYGLQRRRIEIVKLRGASFYGGYHDYEIETGGVRVYPRLAAVNHNPAEHEPGSLSGVGELDSLLGGGLDRGTSTLIIGPAGAGKSSIALQYATAAADRGEYGMVFTFDEGLRTLFQRARELKLNLAKHVQEGTLLVKQLDPGEITPGSFIQQIRVAVERQRLRVLVLDSVNGFMAALADQHEMMPQLHELISYLNERNVVTILVMAQYGILGSSMATPVDVSYLADTVVLLRFFEAHGRVRRAISVVKKRSGGHEHSIREFQIGPGGIVVGAPVTDFHGVLSGSPVFVGASEQLMN